MSTTVKWFHFFLTKGWAKTRASIVSSMVSLMWNFMVSNSQQDQTNDLSYKQPVRCFPQT